jgi:protein ImuA
MERLADQTLIKDLQQQIMTLQGHKQPDTEQGPALGLGPIETAFPGGIFPRGVIHELISTSSEEATCTSGFISVMLGKLMQQTGTCLWISTVPRRSIFPPVLKFFGIEPDRIVFVDAAKPKDTLWALEEALKCDALTAVVGEVTELSFNDSRRLQLAVERSKVNGFIHRFRPKTENAVACVSRWKITPLESITPNNLPGVGFPTWHVQLLKVRSGQPDEWQVQWGPQGLEYLDRKVIALPETYERQIG